MRQAQRLLAGASAAAGAAVASGAAAALIARRRARGARREVLSDTCDAAAADELHAAKAERIARAIASSEPEAWAGEQDGATPLDRILHIDADAQTCVAEPGVAFVDLVAATLRRGLLPAVAPERGTVGSAVSTCSLGPTSFHSAAFHDSCVALELVTPEGEVIECTPDGDHALLFQMLHGAPETLGVVSKFTFRLAPARSHVHVVHERYVTVEAFLSSMRRHAELEDVDFLDGIVHSGTSIVLAAGRSVHEAKHVHSYSSAPAYQRATLDRLEDHLNVDDYIHRHRRDDTNPIRRLAHRIQEEIAPTHSASIEVVLPLAHARSFLGWYAREVGQYPIRCTPSKPGRRSPWLDRGLRSGRADDFFVGLAMDVSSPGQRDLVRELDEKAAELGGLRTLPANGHDSAEALRQIWHRSGHLTVRA